MENLSFKIRKNSAEIRNSNRLLVDKNSPNKKKKNERYSAFIKNLVRSKRVKSFEKRKKKEYGEKRRQNFLEKFNKNYKANNTFYSTSKNPKINEILRKLKESGQNKNVVDVINVGKINNNRINKFMENNNNYSNDDEIIKGSKVKKYVEELNKSLCNEKNDKYMKKVSKNNYIKKNSDKINKQDNAENNSHNSSEIDDKDKNNEEKDNLLEGEYYNSLQNIQNDQENYINKKSNIAYHKFKYNYYKLKDEIYKSKEISKINELSVKNQINFSIISSSNKIQENKKMVSSLQKTRFNIRDSKIKVKRKRSNYNEIVNEYANKLFDIKGFNNKNKRMTILDILIKRKISISSQDSHNNKFLFNKKDNQKKDSNADIKLHKYNENIRYLIFQSKDNNNQLKRFDLNEFRISKVDNIELKCQEYEEEKRKYEEDNKGKEVDKKIDNIFTIEKKNDIELSRIKKKNSNSTEKKIRNSFNEKNEYKKVNNNSHSLTNKNLKSELKKIQIANDNKNSKTNDLSIKDHTLQNKYETYNNQINRNMENKIIKSSVLLNNDNSNSISDEENIKENSIQNEEKKLNTIKYNNSKYDELFHNYATNYKVVNKPKRYSKNVKIENNNKYNNTKKNNALKNKVDSNYIYTDKETNEARALLKKKLKASNQIMNTTPSKKEIQKVKTNKAKIKKFKSKNLIEPINDDSIDKKNKNLKLPKDKNVKIKQFKKQKNIKSYYIDDNNNNNIILQNTTYNQTTYNYYLNNEQKKNNKK